jgi:signal transduction histidine kinase/ligand-binding sensor domain-containing protein
MKDGLLSNSLTTICQDHNGFLWIGTIEGLSVYDGHTFKNYTPLDGLPFNFINDCIESRLVPGTMFMGSNGGGLIKWRKGNFSSTMFGASAATNRILSFMEGRQGAIWCGTTEGIFIQQGNTTKLIEGTQQMGMVFNLTEVGDSTVWIASKEGLFIYSFATQQITEFNTGLTKGESVTFVLPDHDCLWISTSDGKVMKIRDNTIVLEISIAHAYIVFLMDDNVGNIWAGGTFGLAEFSKRARSSSNAILITKENGLPENNILSGFCDRENNLWFSTFTQGLVKLEEGTILKFPLQLEHVYNNSAATGFQHHLWIASQDGLWEIWKDENSSWHTFLHSSADGTSLTQLRCVLNDRDRNLVLSSFSGVVRFVKVLPNTHKPSSLVLLKTIKPQNYYRGFDPVTLLVDKDSCLWLSLSNTGVAVIDLRNNNRLQKIITPSEGIPEVDNRVLFQDRDENIWVGGYMRGLSRISKDKSGIQKFRLYTKADGLPDECIRSMFQDHAGKIWIGTRYGGIVVYDSGKFQEYYSLKDGLPSNAVWSITEDNNKTIWVGTELGLASKKNNARNFSIQNALFGYATYGCGMLGDGVVWSTSRQGLALYDYSTERPTSISPTIILTGVQVNNQDIEINDNIELNHDQNNILIRFTGISFKENNTVQYQYLLLPSDTIWQKPFLQQSVNFAALEPGTYTFMVRAINANNIVSNETAKFGFTIQAAFWQTWWFYGLVLFVVTALTTVITRLYVHQKILVERVRMQIASDLHDEVGSTLSGINIFSDMAKNEIEHDTSKTKELIHRIGTSSQEMLESMDDIVWLIHPRNDSLADLMKRLRTFSSEVFEAKDISATYEISNKIEQIRLSMDKRRNIYLIVKEVINNISKHAQCTKVIFLLTVVDGTLTIDISDNGKGIGSAIEQNGNGLFIMQKRADTIRGKLTFSSEEGKGTSVSLKVKIT